MIKAPEYMCEYKVEIVEDEIAEAIELCRRVVAPLALLVLTSSTSFSINSSRKEPPVERERKGDIQF